MENSDNKKIETSPNQPTVKLSDLKEKRDISKKLYKVGTKAISNYQLEERVKRDCEKNKITRKTVKSLNELDNINLNSKNQIELKEDSLCKVEAKPIMPEISEDDFEKLILNFTSEVEILTSMYNQVFSIISGGIMLISPNGQILAASETMLDSYLESTREYIIGRSIYEMNFPIFEATNNNDFVIGMVKQTLDKITSQQSLAVDGKTTDYEKKDIKVKVKVKSIKDKGNNLIGAILVMENDYPVVEYSKELRLRQEKLIKAGEAATTIVHEVRNPLQGINSILQLLIKTRPEDEEIQEYGNILLKEVSSINSILNDYLALIRNIPMKLYPTDMNELCNEVIILTRNIAKTVNITIEKDFDPNLPKLMVDSSKIKQVLVNLISNSIDAIHGDNGKIIVGTNYDYSLNQARIWVLDNGSGISPENLENIHKMFFTTKEKGCGVGLGLANKIIETHGGKIEVETELNKGTKITIVLPELAGLGKANEENSEEIYEKVDFRYF